MPWNSDSIVRHGLPIGWEAFLRKWWNPQDGISAEGISLLLSGAGVTTAAIAQQCHVSPALVRMVMRRERRNPWIEGMVTVELLPLGFLPEHIWGHRGRNPQRACSHSSRIQVKGTSTPGELKIGVVLSVNSVSDKDGRESPVEIGAVVCAFTRNEHPTPYPVQVIEVLSMFQAPQEGLYFAAQLQAIGIDPVAIRGLVFDPEALCSLAQSSDFILVHQPLKVIDRWKLMLPDLGRLEWISTMECLSRLRAHGQPPTLSSRCRSGQIPPQGARCDSISVGVLRLINSIF